MELHRRRVTCDLNEAVNAGLLGSLMGPDALCGDVIHRRLKRASVDVPSSVHNHTTSSTVETLTAVHTGGYFEPHRLSSVHIDKRRLNSVDIGSVDRLKSFHTSGSVDSGFSEHRLSSVHTGSVDRLSSVHTGGSVDSGFSERRLSSVPTRNESIDDVNRPPELALNVELADDVFTDDLDAGIRYDDTIDQMIEEELHSSLDALPGDAAAQQFNVQRSLEPQPSTSLDVYHPHHSSHHSSTGSVSSGGGGVGSPGSPLPLRHKEEDSNNRSSGDGISGAAQDDDDEDDDDGVPSGGSRAQYMSANCVLYTHYSGDVASVVDEHFSRALSASSSYSDKTSNTSHDKESSPMNQRNFPASFWNSNYQPTATVTSHHGYGDPYHPHGSTSSDPWHSHYQQYTAAAHHHRAVHDYHHHHNMAAQYGGLLLPPTARLPPHVTGPHQYSKPEPWGSAAHQARLHHDQPSAHHAHALDSTYSAYPSMAENMQLSGDHRVDVNNMASSSWMSYC